MLTLVTGATGLVGNNVVRALISRGAAVRALVRSTADSRPFQGLDLEIVQGDVCDSDAVRRACHGVTRVVHSAGRVHLGFSGWAEARAVNVDGTRNVAAAAREVGARMVHVSSVDALGLGSRKNPGDEERAATGNVPCPYVLTKRDSERVLFDEVKQGLDAVIVNPVFVLGPWDWKPSSGRMLLEVARGRALLAPRGGNDFCDARNVAQTILTALERGKTGRRYILGGESLSYFEAWTLFAEITGARPPLARVGPIALWVAGAAGSAWGKVTGREPDVNLASIRMSLLEHHFRCDRARQELGYEPGTAREAATAAWQWFCERGYADQSLVA
ncbi:MAG: NAD-dependent epimerase/dehydratase family protein [Pirellulales bacterium]|nr:NAD-dependent epimerase/dehydratase family protein [Pirellulales bacterium]